MKSRAAVDELKNKILKKFPVPLIAGYKKFLAKTVDKSTGAFFEFYEYIWRYITHIFLADYLHRSTKTPRLKVLAHKVLTHNSIENMTAFIEGVLWQNKQDVFLKEVMGFYFATGGFQGSPIKEINEFYRQVKFFPQWVSLKDLMQAHTLMAQFLEMTDFLSSYPLIAKTHRGTFRYMGEEIHNAVGNEDAREGQVFIFSRDGRQSMILNPFFELEDRFIPQVKDFQQDILFRTDVLKHPKFSLSEEEIKYLEGNIDFSPIEEKHRDTLWKTDVSYRIIATLNENPLRVILVEGAPGTGKTSIIASIKHLSTPHQAIFKYYFTLGDPANNLDIFLRFFYSGLNSLLDSPLSLIPRENKAGEEFEDVNREKPDPTQFYPEILNRFRRSGRDAVFLLDDFESACDYNYPGKYWLQDFLNQPWPPSLRFIITTRSGFYPAVPHVRIAVPGLTAQERELAAVKEHLKPELFKNLWDFYRGSSSYIKYSINENILGSAVLPGYIKDRFTDLLRCYQYALPIHKQILDYLAKRTEPVTLGKMSGDLDVYAPLLHQHLSQLQPLLDMRRPHTHEPKENPCLPADFPYPMHDFRYSLFCPAFAKFVREAGKEL